MGLRRLVRGNGLIGILVNEFVEAEAARARDFGRVRDGGLEATEEPRHFSGGLEMPLGVGLEPQACLADLAFFADAGECVLKRPAGAVVVEHVIGSDERRAATQSEARKRFDPRSVATAVEEGGREVDRSIEGLFKLAQLSLEGVYSARGERPLRGRRPVGLAAF